MPSCIAVAAETMSAALAKVAMTSSPRVRTTTPLFSATAWPSTRKHALIAASDASSPCSS